MALNWAARPGSSLSAKPARWSERISSLTCPPPAISTQWPALAAAATMSGSTVVGVMPPTRMAERPVRRVKAVSRTSFPSILRVRGAKSAQSSVRVSRGRPAARSSRAGEVPAST